MFLVNAAMEKISIGTAALIVVLGMAVVFFGLILLMYVTKIAGAIISRKKSAEPAAAPAAAEGEVYTVGICQLVQHVALDAARCEDGPCPRHRRQDRPARRARQDGRHAHGHRRQQDRQAAQPAPVYLHPRDQGLTPLLHRDAHGSCAFPFLRHFVHYAHS